MSKQELQDLGTCGLDGTKNSAAGFKLCYVSRLDGLLTSPKSKSQDEFRCFPRRIVNRYSNETEYLRKDWERRRIS